MQTIDEMIAELENLRNKFGGDYTPEICVRKEFVNHEDNIDVDYYVADSITSNYGDIRVNCPISMNY